MGEKKNEGKSNKMSQIPFPLGGCVRISVFVAADFSLRKPFVEFQQLTPKWAATKSKHDCDTPSWGRDKG